MDEKWNIVNVEAAIFKEDKWLMIKRGLKETHAPNYIAFVGGKVEFKGETENILQKTLLREIHEEVGITVHEKMFYIGNSSFVSDSGDPVINVTFLCEYREGTPHIKNSDEIQEIIWMTLTEIIENDNVIEHIKKMAQLAADVKKCL